MLRLAKERRRPNNGFATRAYSGWHFAGVAKSTARYHYNAVAPALSTDIPGSRDALRAAQKPSRYFILVPPHPAHNPTANTKNPLPTATKDLLCDSPESSVCGD
jgi:hypothetical protein